MAKARSGDEKTGLPILETEGIAKIERFAARIMVLETGIHQMIDRDRDPPGLRHVHAEAN